MWTLGSMRAALRWSTGFRMGFRLGIRIGIGIGSGIVVSSLAATAEGLEPSCLSSPGGEKIRWTRGPEADRAQLDLWCAAVGPPLARRAEGEALSPGADDFAVVSWNVHVGAGAVASLVDDLRAGRLTAGQPVAQFALLLQEVHRDLEDTLRIPPPGARTAPRVAPEGRQSGVLSIARELDLHLLYVPSMRNGGEGPPAEDRGNAILSTLPLRDPWALELPLERERRVAVAARVQLATADGGLLLVSAHLDNRSRWRSALRSFGRGRTEQARWLTHALDGEAAVALGGDFNTWLRGGNARALRLLRESLPLPDAPSRRRTLIIPFFPDREVDHLLFRLPTGWTAGYRVVEDGYGSDHRPLLGVLVERQPSPYHPR